ncbi:VCBS repeat-containing protein [Loktanella sp. D2R18]|uniref:FG-GAP repeat domain-containing protein n=1 Tax=Rhodobacterales TaxID=204455 RepID=UPI000DE9C5DE|nr:MULTISPECIES: VCBS repeat-containing protein [Rhodobacterales]MDO6591714.1 VCBS repeat-containing protein [Yoonia sp. 1_MG-2023]RBW42537.1 VCBS repeat-containing protein [Loktanella sp. D2R18]
MRFCALALALWPVSAGAQSITEAEFTDPTTRYAHGILGDAVEWGGLRFVADGATYQITLPNTHVFEDIAPRLWDMTGDGSPEIVVIETEIARGAALAIYGAEGKIAQTPYIGRTHRWLSPIGAVDLDGDGAIEVAYIDRPHLAKTLRIWRFEDGGLTHVHDLPGLTNHRIGEDNIAGGLRDCGQGPEMITANANWTRIIATVYVGGRSQSRDIGPHVDRSSFASALACEF